MAEPRAFGRLWWPGENEDGLGGFVDNDEKLAFERGAPGPFRRAIAPAGFGTRAEARDKAKAALAMERDHG